MLRADGTAAQASPVSSRPINVFFYGLFMDVEILREAGVEPVDPRRAWVADFAVRIGQRATLVMAPGARSDGMLMGLSHEELKRLYRGPGLDAYRPEAVLVHVVGQDDTLPALCYNLDESEDLGPQDLDYTKRLRALAKRLGLPTDRFDADG